MPQRVVIVGSPADAQAQAVAERVRASGHEPFVLDAQQFPADLHVSLGPAMAQIRIGGERIEPASVYVRSLYASPAAFGADAEDDMAEDWRRTMLVYRERATVMTALVARWEHMGVPMYNPPSASGNIVKPYQLALLADAGLPVPDTLWTNAPAEVRAFARGRRIAYKPVSGGAATQELSEDDLTDERLATLGRCPVTFQELLPGDDIRVYVLDGEIVTALRIETDALDFRQNEQAIAPIELPSEVRAQCTAATQALGLRFTGMDLKGDVNGTLRILELNPSPMFVGFDAQAGTDIVGRLAHRLCTHLR